MVPDGSSITGRHRPSDAELFNGCKADAFEADSKETDVRFLRDYGKKGGGSGGGGGGACTPPRLTQIHISEMPFMWLCPLSVVLLTTTKPLEP